MSVDNLIQKLVQIVEIEIQTRQSPSVYIESGELSSTIKRWSLSLTFIPLERFEELKLVRNDPNISNPSQISQNIVEPFGNWRCYTPIEDFDPYSFFKDFELDKPSYIILNIILTDTNFNTIT